MEDKHDSPQPNKLCSKACGFYANSLYEGMCSKCFRDHKKANEAASATAAASTAILTQAHAAAADAAPTSTAAAVAAAAGPTQSPRATPALPAAETPAVPSAPAIADPDAGASMAPVPPPSVASPGAGACAAVPKRRSQKNKGRCFLCRSRVPLVKQTTNRCRCDYVFCDEHRYPDQHDCDFDHMARDRLQLQLTNPKLNSRPKGGVSFNRID
ncbi:hypothetical protein GGF46_000435 [Coemansia sp. RSA 552]|nr:hypothetical protein GGF46_000435 [Coemansia sp. RSA 552]